MLAMGYRYPQAMIRILAWGWLVVSTCAAAAHTPQPHLSHGIARFQAAYQQWDGDGFWNAANDFQQAVAESPNSPTGHYWLGVSHFHRMLQLRSLNQEALDTAADTEMAAAIESLDTAVELNPKDAESHAILATLYGMRIEANLLLALRYGPLVQSHQKQALASGPNNPRVQYLLGVGLLKTARDNDDRTAALATLLKAESLFETENRSAPTTEKPHWGHDACLTFIAQAHAELGHRDDAIAYYRKSLAARPHNQPALAGLNHLLSP